MKIAILSRKPSLYSTGRLKEAGEKRGHEMHVIASGGIGLPGAAVRQADLDVHVDGLRHLALPFVDADEQVELDFFEKDFVHWEFSALAVK